jgi:hypothetical protein
MSRNGKAASCCRTPKKGRLFTLKLSRSPMGEMGIPFGMGSVRGRVEQAEGIGGGFGAQSGPGLYYRNVYQVVYLLYRSCILSADQDYFHSFNYRLLVFKVYHTNDFSNISVTAFSTSR